MIEPQYSHKPEIFAAFVGIAVVACLVLLTGCADLKAMHEQNEQKRIAAHNLCENKAHGIICKSKMANGDVCYTVLSDLGSGIGISCISRAYALP